jgi:hypothetical protein
MVPTRALQWSIGIERQLVQNLMVDVAYVGTRSLDLTSAYNINQPFPGPGAQNPRRPEYALNPLVGDVTYNTGWGSAKYHGLQVKLEKRYSAGLTLSVAYTWASYFSDAPNLNGGGVGALQDARCFNCNWGPVPDDLKHVFVLNHAFELPFGGEPATSATAGLPKSSAIGTSTASGPPTAASASMRRLRPPSRTRPVAAATAPTASPTAICRPASAPSTSGSTLRHSPPPPSIRSAMRALAFSSARATSTSTSASTAISPSRSG